MESLLSLLNEYELFNNIFPGIIFLYFSNLQNYIPILDKIDIYEKLFLYYFIGLIISRIGSLFLEPFFLKLEIIKFADYSKFLKAEEKESKIFKLIRRNKKMRYEIDFIATKENKENADAICFRYEKDGKLINVVYDGGSKVLANKLIEHLEEFYFKNEYYPKIDYLICSHPDQDHASGIIEVIEKFEIGKIIMNIPWKYIYDIWDNVNDGRISKESLEKHLKDDYPYVAEIEKLAKEKGIEIIEGFEDKQINENLKILSPSKEFFIELLKKSKKTEYLDESDYKSDIYTESAKSILSKITNWIKEL